jgi:uncharacterized repeat protein (TIGR03803 family)
VVFKINTDGSGYTVLKNLLGNGGCSPESGLALADGVLYGATAIGGAGGCGFVFKVGSDGMGYTVLANLYSLVGRVGVRGSLVLGGGALFAPAYSYGGDCNDSVFMVNTDGTGFAVLKRFTGGDVLPQGGMVLAAGTPGTLYGTTEYGGSLGYGAVFKVNTDTTDFAVLKSFSGSDGAGPAGGLVLAGNTLYGTASGGGVGWNGYFESGQGVVFQIQPDGTGFAVLKNFLGSDGAGPIGELVSTGTVLYGTTSSGGSSNCGVVFVLDWGPPTPPTIIQAPQNCTAAPFTTALFSTVAAGSEPLFYQWFFNATNPVAASQGSTLQLTNVQLSQAGDYAVVVSNAFGEATSPPALLTVIPLPPTTTCTRTLPRAWLALWPTMAD